MKRLIKATIVLLISSAPVYANGPLFRYRDTYLDREFKNVYGDIETVLNSTDTGKCLGDNNFCVDYSTWAGSSIIGNNLDTNDAKGTVRFLNNSLNTNNHVIRFAGQNGLFDHLIYMPAGVNEIRIGSTNGTDTYDWVKFRQGGPVWFSSGSVASPGISFMSDTTSGVILDSMTLTGFVNRGVEAFGINGTGQIVSMINGTALWPSFGWIRDAGSGPFLFAVDSPGMSAGSSTATVWGKTSPTDYQDDVPISWMGAFSGTANTNAAVGNHIYTSSATTTANKIAQLDQAACFIIVSGRDAGFSNGFTDLLLASYSNPGPTVITSRTEYGAPPARTYSSGGAGILRLTMASGSYLIGTTSIQFSGR